MAKSIRPLALSPDGPADRFMATSGSVTSGGFFCVASVVCTSFAAGRVAPLVRPSCDCGHSHFWSKTGTLGTLTLYQLEPWKRRPGLTLAHQIYHCGVEIEPDQAAPDHCMSWAVPWNGRLNLMNPCMARYDVDVGSAADPLYSDARKVVRAGRQALRPHQSNSFTLNRCTYKA